MRLRGSTWAWPGIVSACILSLACGGCGGALDDQADDEVDYEFEDGYPDQAHDQADDEADDEVYYEFEDGYEDQAYDETDWSLDGTDVTLERYPWLKAPAAVDWGGGLEVAASLELEAPEPQAVAAEIVLPDRDGWQLDVVLEAPDFEIVDGGPLRTIEMEPEGGSSSAAFTLRAPVAESEDSTPVVTEIAVSFWFENRFLARTSKQIAVGGEAPPPDVEPPGAVAALDLDLDREEADLVVTLVNNVLILSAPALGNRPTYQVIEPLSAEDRRQLQQQYDELAAVASTRNLGAGQAAATEESDTRARATAVRAGRNLWRLAPDAFKDAYWDLVDRLGDDFDSVQIYADDPTIPWELMRPSREGSPERDFLGLELEVARGHAPEEGGGFGQMPRTVPFERLLVMRPQYDPPLLGTAAEVASLEVLGSLSPELVASTYGELARVAQDLPDGILHFAGHGVETRSEHAGSRYAIVLDRPVTLSEWLGLLPEPRFRNRPFIFFNACDVGKSQELFGFAEGWAPAFLEAGAAGYIGTLWPVADGAAARFAIRFYEVLAESMAATPGVGHPSRAVREARRLFAEDPDPTYLAYVYYGETDLGLAGRREVPP